MTVSGLRAVLLAMASAVLIGRVARANPLDLYGLGARARGMGGAYTAVSDDFSALYYNPAGMAGIMTNRFEVGFFTADPNATIDLVPAAGATAAQRRSLEALEARQENLRGVSAYELGMVVAPHPRFKAGVGLYAPADGAVRLHSINPHIPTFALFDHYAERSVAMIAASFTVLPGLSVGVGTHLFVNVSGDLSIPITASNERSGDLGTDPLDPETELTIEFPWTSEPFVGVMYQLNKRWRFGGAYRSEFGWDVEIRADLDLLLKDYAIDLAQIKPLDPDGSLIDSVIEIKIPALGDTPIKIPLEIESLAGSLVADIHVPVEAVLAMTDFWQPQQASLGAAWEPTDQWTFSADATWYDWSEIPTPKVDIEIKDVDIHLQTLPANIQARIRNLTIPILGTVGPVPPVTLSIPGLQTSLSIPIRFQQPAVPPAHDVIHPRLGAEYRFLPLYSDWWTGALKPALRGGYAYEPSPFETDSGYTNLIDPDRHLFSAGAGVNFNDRFTLDTYWQYRYLEKTSFSKDAVDRNMPFKKVEAAGDVWATGIQAGVRWP